MRLAVDTNVLARAIADDGSEQARISRQCFLENGIFVSHTVLLETEWLFRSRLKLSRDDMNPLFARLLRTSGVQFETRTRVEAAVSAHAGGMDFADALHLLISAGCDAFATFDQDFIQRHRIVPDAMPVRNP